MVHRILAGTGAILFLNYKRACRTSNTVLSIELYSRISYGKLRCRFCGWMPKWNRFNFPSYLEFHIHVFEAESFFNSCHIVSSASQVFLMIYKAGIFIFIWRNSKLSPKPWIFSKSRTGMEIYIKCIKVWIRIGILLPIYLLYIKSQNKPLKKECGHLKGTPR